MDECRTRVEEVCKKCAGASPEDCARILQAYEVANKAHEGQMRKGGGPYIVHPVAVAEIVCEMGLDADSVIAALLHDTVEDTNTSLADIRKLFGPQVEEMVDGLTKLANIQYESREEEEMENLRKMFIAMAKDIRVIMIKIADRLHNMRTISALSPERQQEISLETMEIYAPIAHRLGMTRYRHEMEDLALQILDPVGYKEITDFLTGHRVEGQKFLDNICRTIREKMEENGIDCEVMGRVKHIYSIYRKAFSQHKELSELYDIYGIRVIVDDQNDCYNVLGIVHDVFKPIPGRFKDYISTPKPNMYQSLHTTVIGREGVPFEIQIRTREMHRIAEYGIAAHWKYKQGITGSGDRMDDRLDWVRHLVESQQDTDAEDFIKSLKVDMFADAIYVFTPRGDVISLPQGGTPVDFAYAIHSQIGNRMVGCKVNGKMVPIDTALQNGDIVEVVTGPAGRGPSRDWLLIAKTSQAKNKIRQWFKKERYEENLQEGRRQLEEAMRRNRIPVELLENDLIREQLPERLSFRSLDDLLAGIGYGGVTVIRVMNKLTEMAERINRTPLTEEDTLNRIVSTGDGPRRTSESGVLVAGFDSVKVKFAHCCTPVPGEDIVGFVTRGCGVSVHRRDCVNVQAILRADGPEKDRVLDARWADTQNRNYSAAVCVYAKDRFGLVADVAGLMATRHVVIQSISARKMPDGAARVEMLLQVQGIEELSAICERLRNIPGVTTVSRDSH